jgi:protein-disulfide isomerase
MSTQTRDQRRAAARAQREQAERAAEAAERRRTRLLQLGGVLALAAAVVVAVVLLTGGGSDGSSTAGSAPAADQPVNGRAEIAEQLRGIPQDGLTLGDPDAPITVIEFVDLQCPVCAQFSNQLMPTIVNDYVRPGDVRFELRVLSFLGEDSVRMAKLAHAAAEQDRAFHFAELVYANQGAENSGYATDDYLRRIAGAIRGLDVERAMRDRDAPEAEQALADADRLASIEGVQGTPSFLVGPTGGDLKLVDANQLEAELDRLVAKQS